MTNRHLLVAIIAIGCFFLAAIAEARPIAGSVRDAETLEPLANVELRAGESSCFSDAAGRFSFAGEADQLVIRLPGYRPQQVSVSADMELQLEPFAPKALYLSFWAADVPEKRQQFIELIEKTELNAVVIDIKTSRGHIAYRSEIPLAAEIGAQRVRPLKDLPEFLAELKARGIYTIARMVVFKDDLLAKQRPELAALTIDGEIWQDREKISWTDPFNQEVRDYNIAVAEEAARLGFDEVQFDYIRFPAKSDLIFSDETTDDSRVAAINQFLSQAKQRLANYPVFTSANIFGYICWKHRDGKIGQRLVDLGDRVDYLAPMLYPSGFTNGIPGYGNPVENPFEVIAFSLLKAEQLSGLAPVRFRPWLQAFRDYAFDRRPFNADEVSAQITASDVFDSNGWMLWNAASRFSVAGLQLEEESAESSAPAMLSRIAPNKLLPPAL